MAKDYHLTVVSISHLRDYSENAAWDVQCATCTDTHGGCLMTTISSI